jgi:rod shape-determining protein MreC
MRKLLDFLIENRHWTLLAALLLLCGTMMFYNTPYQRIVFVSSANAIVGKISSAVGSISSHMKLRETNRILTARNGILEKQIIDLQQQLGRQQALPIADSTEVSPYRFVMARVIRNSVSQRNNYITIDKGTNDGIAAGMGVVAPDGVVGIVSNTSARFAVILPLLNPRHRLSCRLAGTGFFGSLVWDGASIRHAQLEELPRHMQVQKGDTVVTSGFSAIFPPGIIVGTVSDYYQHYDNNFYAAEVALSVNFSALSNVHIITNSLSVEQSDLEQEAQLW